MRYRSRNYHGLTLDIISAVLFYLSVVIMVILISLRLHEDVYIIHYFKHYRSQQNIQLYSFLHTSHYLMKYSYTYIVGTCFT